MPLFRRFNIYLLAFACLCLQPQQPGRSSQQLASIDQVDVERIVKLGLQDYRSGNYNTAITQWEKIDLDQLDLPQQAIVLENLARAYQKIGRTESELRNWEKIKSIYQQLQQPISIARIEIEIAQALTRQGFSSKAIQILCHPQGHLQDSLTIAECQVDSAIGRVKTDRQLLASGLGSLGEAYRVQGKHQIALDLLQQAISSSDRPLDQSEVSPSLLATLQNSLGNTLVRLADNSYQRSNSFARQGDQVEAQVLQQQAIVYDQQAAQAYESAITLNQGQSIAQLPAMLGLLPVQRRLQPSRFQATWQQAHQIWQQLPDSQNKVYSGLDLAKRLAVQSNRCPIDQSEAQRLVKASLQIAQRLQDNRAISFSFGQLGQLLECQGQLESALNFTKQAQYYTAENLANQDSLYLWQWQEGRILKAQAQLSAAQVAYQSSVNTLESIRNELLNSDRTLQLEFRENIEPVYRDLIQLQLNSNNTNGLSKALGTANLLKLAELQNYFGNDCILNLNQSALEVAAKSNTDSP